MLGFSSRRHPEARIVHLNFNAADPVQLARRLAADASVGHEPLYLLIDCRNLACLRSRGMGYFIDQLLLIRRSGVRLLLYNASPVLRRALSLLGLGAHFELTGRVTAAAA
ncbi:hypothetical protein LJ737_10440 [Hymenobacter sp. 15J16-1T3B]|uniref:STAS domain-containing protein n=1 Tax=Hymenobacter sp. 15J16-1T3B TaxID=2886941 RepID=UPI001D116F9D|nr:STAS domain-containing protein [Hymenobacter sp. 15J16-1T3B]MCC3157659.1 hypothetical protein [Hymenobacter sp. 15J16-1T3B]